MLLNNATRDTTSSGMAIFKKPRPGKLPHYELPDNQVSVGASLGNHNIWVDTKATGAIEHVFSTSAGVSMLGSIVVTYAIPSRTLITSSPQEMCLDETEVSYVLASQEGVGTFEIYPFSQKHSFDITGELHVEETILVPKLIENDPAAVLQHIEVTNFSEDDVELLVSVFVDLKGDIGDDLVVQFDADLGALVVHNAKHPHCARVVGAESCEVAFRTTHDVSAGYAGAYTQRISQAPQTDMGPIGQLQVMLSIRSGKTAETTIAAAVSSNGIEEAKATFECTRAFDSLSESTVAYLTPKVSVSMVETPDTIINQGVFWSKVNMLKVMSDYPEGPAFTNEPGKSSNVVGRDAAWFVYGCNYLDQKFSRQLLIKLAEKQYDNGKIPEYYNALNGKTEDYGISMNDNTPLFILACCHHYYTTHDKSFLHEIYPNTSKAAKYILSQRDDTGMVISKADGTEVHGIASWRNVIPGYQINGAVTEINAECYGAIRHVSGVADTLDEKDDAKLFKQAADDLYTAINYRLYNPDNGLYYLNIDMDNQAHTDVTADEIFPVLFEVAPPGVSCRIIARLRAEDFMTPAGLRTVSRNSPDYEPTKLIGLRGGVWPGVAFWYAFASMAMNPEFMVDIIHASYLQYLLNPLKNNTVPGQFSEWFDGESLVNRGMRLSPWEPPRLLWAAVEGLCGARPTTEGYELCPNMPPDWKWLALRRLPWKAGHMTFFMARINSQIHIYSNQQVETKHELHVVGTDVSHRVHVMDYRVHRAAFSGEEELTLCLGSEADTSVTVQVEITDLLQNDKLYKAKIFGSVFGWIELGTRTGEDISQLSVSIEDDGFRILVISPE